MCSIGGYEYLDESDLEVDSDNGFGHACRLMEIEERELLSKMLAANSASSPQEPQLTREPAKVSLLCVVRSLYLKQAPRYE